MRLIRSDNFLPQMRQKVVRSDSPLVGCFGLVGSFTYKKKTGFSHHANVYLAKARQPRRERHGRSVLKSGETYCLTRKNLLPVAGTLSVRVPELLPVVVQTGVVSDGDDSSVPPLIH